MHSSHTNHETAYSSDPNSHTSPVMNAALQAIKNAGDKGNCRDNVIKGFFAIKNKSSVLGTYSIDPDGDTTITDYGGNTVQGGKLTFDKVIKAQQ